jgi:competence protein ComEC
MPLIALALAAYAGGVLLGFAGLVAPAVGVAASLALASYWRPQRGLRACAALVVAGAAVAQLAVWHGEQCRSPLVARGRIAVELSTPASPGTLARGRLHGGCPGRVSISVKQGQAAAGAVVEVTGRLFVTSDGILAKQAGLKVRRAPGALARWRARIGSNLTRDFDVDAPLARALLIADMSDISHETRDKFAQSGLVHILSISGLHVTIVASAVVLILEAARLSRRTALIGGCLLTALYVALIGAPPPAVRSAVMFGSIASAKLLQRPSSPWAALALGAAWPLPGDPRVVLDIGWQLTIAGMVGLIVAGEVNRRHVSPRFTGWRQRLATEITTGIMASLVTAPLVAWYFGRTSLIAPLANLAANPVANLLQPTLFLALALGAWPALAGWVADACRPGLRALDMIAGGAAAIPGADIATVPTLTTSLVSMIAIAALLAAVRARRPMRWIAASLAALALIAWWPIPPRPSGDFELHMLDVGQGDALALRTPRGRWIIIDAGRSWTGGDAGRRVVVPYVQRRGGDVALFILSHPDEDHVGGAPSVIAALRPREYWDAAFVAANESYQRSLRNAASTNALWRRVRPGDTTRIDGVLLRVLAPDSAWTARQRGPNEASVVVMAEYGAHRFLLTGDAEHTEEQWLRDRWGDSLQADVLKSGHHGSKTSSTQVLLDAVRPQLALISVGAGNGYGHPSPSVLDRYAEAGILALRTDQLGTIVVASDGRHLRVAGRDGRWSPAPR